MEIIINCSIEAARLHPEQFLIEKISGPETDAQGEWRSGPR
ncbi:MAG: hypothetical protein U9R79_21935 [Armatimonadota bacterium]|nr:hypothetical protein [Armatimonadota bacterium]